MSYLGNNSYILNRRKIAYTYNITTASTARPLSLTEVKSFLKIDSTDSSEDAFLIMLIDSATLACEKYTGRDLINKGYTTFRDNFCDPLELRRAKVSAIGSISYLVNNVFVVISSAIYGVENVNNFPYIYLKVDKEWPIDGDVIPQSIKILFTSGYGSTASNVPADLRMGLLNHINAMYSNRSDCGGDCSDANGGGLPGTIKSLYNPYKIISIGSYERPPYNYDGVRI